MGTRFRKHLKWSDRETHFFDMPIIVTEFKSVHVGSLASTSVVEKMFSIKTDITVKREDSMEGSLTPGLTGGMTLTQGNLFVVGKLLKIKAVPIVDDMKLGDEGQAIVIPYINIFYICLFLYLSNINRGIFVRSFSICHRCQ